MTTKLGIAGGGQLARMMLSTCIDWDCQLTILDKRGSVSEAFCQNFVTGDYRNKSEVFEALKDCEVVTLDLESVNLEGLIQLEESGVRVAPSSSVLSIIQNKIKQKNFFKDKGIATSAFKVIPTLEESTPKGFLKIPEGGYDGKGVCSWDGDLAKLDKTFHKDILWEEAIEIEKEISVIGVRGITGEVLLYHPTEMAFDPQLNLISHTIFPSTLTLEQTTKAQDLAMEVMSELKPVGILAIEMFLTKKGDLLVNELAPRPHNSGHHTIESCKTSQFENHVRAVLGYPLGSTKGLSNAVTFNIIGSGEGASEWLGLEEVMAMEDVYLHNYGKKNCKEGRKMGHITITGPSHEIVLAKLEKIRSLVRVKGAKDE